MIRPVRLRAIDATPGLHYTLRFAALDAKEGIWASLDRAVSRCQDVVLTRSCLIQAGSDTFDISEAGWLSLKSRRLAVELLCAYAAPDSSNGSAAGKQSPPFKRVSARVITLDALGAGSAERICIPFDDATHFCTVLLEVRNAEAKDAGVANSACKEASDDSRLQCHWPIGVADGLIVRETPKTCSTPVKLKHSMEDIPSKVTLCRGRPLLHEVLAASENLEVTSREIDTLRSSDVRDKFGGEHVVVLVPGYGMQASDMRTLRNYFSLVLEKARFCVPSADVCDCDDLHRSGVRLAHEVDAYIKQCCGHGAELGRLSFVAVTTGGLKVRAALSWLREYASKIYGLITICTPHLGLLPKSLSFLHRGLFLAVRTMAPREMFETLALADGRHAQESMMFKLSRDNGIKNFRKIVFMSTSMDWQFPAFSSRAEYIAENHLGLARLWSNPSSRWIMFAMLALFFAMLAFWEVLEFSLFWLGPVLSQPATTGRGWTRLFRMGLLGITLVGYRVRNYLSLGPWAHMKTVFDPDADNCSLVMARNLSERTGDAQLIRVDIDFALRLRCWIRGQPMHTHILQSRAYLRALAQGYAVLLQ